MFFKMYIFCRKYTAMKHSYKELTEKLRDWEQKGYLRTSRSQAPY